MILSRTYIYIYTRTSPGTRDISIVASSACRGNNSGPRDGGWLDGKPGQSIRSPLLFLPISFSFRRVSWIGRHSIIPTKIGERALLPVLIRRDRPAMVNNVGKRWRRKLTRFDRVITVTTGFPRVSRSHGSRHPRELLSSSLAYFQPSVPILSPQTYCPARDFIVPLIKRNEGLFPFFFFALGNVQLVSSNLDYCVIKFRFDL